MVCDQLGAFKRSFKSITITAQQLGKFAHIVVRESTGFLAFKESSSASATKSTALPKPAAGQETFMNEFQAALLITIKSIAPPASSASQQAVSASTHLSSVHLFQQSGTDTGSQLTTGLESDMDLQHFGADLGEGAAHGTEEFQPKHQPKNRTSAITIETTKPKKPAPQKAVPKAKKYISGHTSRPKKRKRILEGEAGTSTAVVFA